MKQSLHAKTDEVLRGKIAAAPAPAGPPTGAWEQLERRLDHPADAPLRAALNNLPPAAVPAAGWEALAGKLPDRSPADEQLAEALNELQPPPPPGSWERLSERLSELDAAAVDTIVAGHLAPSAAAPATGWAALAARLELIGQRREQVIAWKITETALMLSLLLLLLRFAPLPSPKPDGSPEAEQSAGTAFLAPSAVSTGEFTPPTAELPAEPTAPAREPFQRPQSTPPPAAATGVPQVAPTAEVPTRAAPAAGSEPVMPVPLLDIEPLDVRFFLPRPVLTLPEPPPSEPVIYYGNAFVSPLDINLINTPQNRVSKLDITSRQFLQQGVSGGLLLDIVQGKHGLQVGAIYSHVGYQPTALEHVYGEDPQIDTDSIRGFDQFEYQTIEVPLAYKLTFSENSKWRVGMRVGMSWRVIAVANYEGLRAVNESLDYGDRVTINALPPSGVSAQSSLGTGKARLRNPTPGWWQGGSVLNNSSLHLNGGLVIERLLTPRWSLYASPTVSKVLYFNPQHGVGPYRDRINVGSVRLGGRYRFGH